MFVVIFTSINTTAPHKILSNVIYIFNKKPIYSKQKTLTNGSLRSYIEYTISIVERFSSEVYTVYTPVFATSENHN